MKHKTGFKREELRQVNIRITPDLYELIVKSAIEQKRSVSAQMAFVVEKAFTAQTAEAAR